MSDWQAAQAARDAASQRRHLESLDRAIAEVGEHLATARDFEGHFSEQLAAVEAQISAIDFAFAAGGGYPHIVRAPSDAGLREVERLRGVRDAIVAERDERRKAATVHSVGQFGRELSLCTLSSIDLTRRLGQLRAQRGALAEQLAALESTLTPGQLCEAGQAAPDYTEYVRKAETLRTGRGVVVGYSA